MALSSMLLLRAFMLLLFSEKKFDPLAAPEYADEELPPTTTGLLVPAVSAPVLPVERLRSASAACARIAASADAGAGGFDFAS